MDNEIFLRFPNGLLKALTFSYDDGVYADKRLMALFDKYNLLATFNLNSGVFSNNAHNRMTKEATIALFKNCRHEIALHGHKHIFLTKVDRLRGINEVLENKKALEGFFGGIIDGFAYAYGAYNNEVKDYLKLLNVKYARTTISTGKFDIPSDFLELHPTCHHGDKNLMEYADKFLNTYPDKNIKEREPYLFYVWGHSYEFDENNNWYIIEDFAKKVSNNKEVYYATNIELYRYINAFNNLEFSVDAKTCYNPSALTVWFEKQQKIYKIEGGKTVVCD